MKADFSERPTPYGQGKRVTTLLTEDGCYFPVISHAPYIERCYLRTAPFPQQRTPMGRHSQEDSTFNIGDGGRSKTEFITTSKQTFGGSKSLNPAKRPPLSRSMHISQLDNIISNKYGEKTTSNGLKTRYNVAFKEKDIIPANILHQSSLVNRTNQTKGTDVCEAVRPSTTVATYWSQYGRIHSKLGSMLGPGVPQSYPIRQQYNVITGESKGPAWTEENARISGNRVLNSCRQKLKSTPIIS
ncbi:hypothetical protein LOTGIDRAFT_238991 [Lottia gigantea]|uniref:Uncharacterized protein n=1 Tax=Lottia gigantea TaxID=225164 RepID=V4AUL6_LOTGI|nr:hypothetical protein LOTGIDRAFT_238991 [Lottia gigantea]ESO98635.1 hypothetical protein LOTGIDRAFT_238991 [Lottia gigantea]